jgi:hypothetical protein
MITLTGPITSIECSSVVHIAATVGKDGSVRIFDYVGKKDRRPTLLASRAFNSAGSVVTSVPQSLDPSGNSFAAGFADGVVRIVQYLPESAEIRLVSVSKPHKRV